MSSLTGDTDGSHTMKNLWFLGMTGAVLASGCYAYSPSVAPAPTPPNTSVELVLSTEAQIRLRDRAGIDQRAVRGNVVEDDGTTMMIDVQSTSPMEGLGGSPLYQRIDLRRADVLELRVRQLSQSRSLVMGAVAVGAGTAVVLTTIYGDRNPGGAPPGDGGGVSDRVSQALPVIRIP